MRTVLLIAGLGGFGFFVGAAMIVKGLKAKRDGTRFSLSQFMFQGDLRRKMSRAQWLGEGLLALLVALGVFGYAAYLFSVLPANQRQASFGDLSSQAK